LVTFNSALCLGIQGSDFAFRTFRYGVPIVAKALLKNKKITVKEAAKRLKVDPSTLYRYLPGGRSAIEEET